MRSLGVSTQGTPLRDCAGAVWLFSTLQDCWLETNNSFRGKPNEGIIPAPYDGPCWFRFYFNLLPRTYLQLCLYHTGGCHNSWLSLSLS